MRVSYLLLISLALFFASACEDDEDSRRFVGSGNIVAQTRAATAFTAIDISGVVRARVVSGNEFSVTIQADDNIIDRVITEVRNGQLSIFLNGDSFSSVSVRATVVMPSLGGLSGSGASAFDVAAFDQSFSDMSISLSGTCELLVSDCRYDNVSVSLSGTGEAKCFGLNANKADVDLSGTSELEITARTELTGSASGTSEIRYRGNPTINVNTSGTAEVIDAN